MNVSWIADEFLHLSILSHWIGIHQQNCPVGSYFYSLSSFLLWKIEWSWKLYIKQIVFEKYTANQAKLFGNLSFSDLLFSKTWKKKQEKKDQNQNSQIKLNHVWFEKQKIKNGIRFSVKVMPSKVCHCSWHILWFGFSVAQWINFCDYEFWVLSVFLL